MELSCRSEYALLAMLELASNYNSGEAPLHIRQIAALQNIPERYLEQVLAALRRSGLIVSERGKNGGYLLAREPRHVTLLGIVSCMQGEDVLDLENGVTLKTVTSFEVLKIWQEAKQASNAVLEQYTLQDLLDKRNNRRQPAVMYYI
ncbi:MAG: Rrf2 family transcriptional regulator [Myxacorys californica WJT36-NPBG1]|nr:Rrf2 family transcriptional regulator [Myxacorys californica WJT36-NPBG1]